MIPKATRVRLSRGTRSELEGWLRASTTEQRRAQRARIILLAAKGHSSRAIAREVGVQPRIVSKWRMRFAADGIEALEDKARPGAKPVYSEATGKRILAILDRPVPAGRARWTGDLVAEALGDVDVNYVRRFLRKQKIDLAGRKSWCESNDPNFAAKAADIVGLYLAPPENAIVICVDEKPSIQALERAQGYLKLPNGRCLTGHSHDYKRARHNYTVCSFRSCNRQSKSCSQEAPTPQGVSRLHGSSRGSLAKAATQGHPRQSQHTPQKREVAGTASSSEIPLYADTGLVAQPGRMLVLQFAGQLVAGDLLHLRRAADEAHRRLH
jgi:transposase